MEKLVGGLPDDLIPGAPVAYACFGTWENANTCIRIDEAEDPFDGCSQSVECRRYTLEQNPPTTRFAVKPRRDGRFEIQQFRDFIGTHLTYQLDIQSGEIVITFPGDRSVPKSRRFFLHVKHVEEAKLSLEKDFELVMTLEKMILHQASDEPAEEVVPVNTRASEDPEARRKRIAERLKNRASEAASSDDIDDDLDFDIDLDDLEDEPVSVETPVAPTSEVVEEAETVATTEIVKEEEDDDSFLELDDFDEVEISDEIVPDSDLDEEDRIPQEADELDEEEEGEESGEGEADESSDGKKAKKAAKDDTSKTKKPKKSADAEKGGSAKTKKVSSASGKPKKDAKKVKATETKKTAAKKKTTKGKAK
jgi:hypothetical protein